MLENIQYTSIQEFMDIEIAPYYFTKEDYSSVVELTVGTENISEFIKQFAHEFTKRLLDIKNIFRGIRKSNIIFHKSEYGQYRKMNIFRYNKIMSANYDTLKKISPVYKPADMIVKYRDTSMQVCALLDILNMPYTAYYLLSQIKDLLKLIKRNNQDVLVYNRMYDNTVKLSKFEDVKTQFSIVLAHFNTNHKNKTVLKYKFSDLFNSIEDFKETDKVLDTHHTLLKRATTVESVVLSIEKEFDEIIYYIENASMDKDIIITLSSIADIISITFNAYGYSISRLNELLHNHVLNLESIGSQL